MVGLPFRGMLQIFVSLDSATGTKFFILMSIIRLSVCLEDNF